MNEAYRFLPSQGIPKFRRAELVLNNNVIAIGNLAFGAPGSLDIDFANVCPTADSTAYVLRVVYGSCINPAEEVSFGQIKGDNGIRPHHKT